MFKSPYFGPKSVAVLSLSTLILTGCATQQGYNQQSYNQQSFAQQSHNQASATRYGGQNAACCVQTECVTPTTGCGYYVVPVYQTVEKEVVREVEKEVIRELPAPPPVIIREPVPCPSDTMPDANGACIRTVTVELPPPPPVTIPCYTCRPEKK